MCSDLPASVSLSAKEHNVIFIAAAFQASLLLSPPPPLLIPFSPRLLMVMPTSTRGGKERQPRVYILSCTGKSAVPPKQRYSNVGT